MREGERVENGYKRMESVVHQSELPCTDSLCVLACLVQAAPHEHTYRNEVEYRMKWIGMKRNEIKVVMEATGRTGFVWYRYMLSG